MLAFVGEKTEILKENLCIVKKTFAWLLPVAGLLYSYMETPRCTVKINLTLFVFYCRYTNPWLKCDMLNEIHFAILLSYSSRRVRDVTERLTPLGNVPFCRAVRN